MQPVVLITRPDPDATALAEEIRLRWPALRVLVSPQQEIVFTPLPTPERGEELIFTSRNGVRAWIRSGLTGPTRAYCVGDATAEAAQAAGFSAISAGGTAEDLGKLIREEAPTARLVHLRGAVHRGDLAERLSAEGLAVRAVTAYRQQEKPLSAEALGVMNGGDPVLVPLYSPRSARLFATAWNGSAPLMIAAISPVIAGIVAPLRPRVLELAAQPNGGTMLVALAGLVSRSHQLEAGRGAV